jgi:hypothetical protein
MLENHPHRPLLQLGQVLLGMAPSSWTHKSRHQTRDASERGGPRTGQPWRNGYVESLNARVRDECLNINIF